MTRDELMQLIPHAGAMCLLDRAERWTPEYIRCWSRTHHDAGHPLRRQGKVHAVHAVEYGAQAAALHGALLQDSDGESPSGALLVAVRKVRLYQAYLDAVDGDLLVEAWREQGDGSGMSYRFSVSGGDTVVAEGRLLVAGGRDEE
ncbi:MAG TPA: hydroxymyristoyl-ACP dehydratase [Chromatiales bacterium]|nr:hydroxymyristoyl-ACP dehydratase [Chromatiales bacterium]